jgi:predicted ArsR family transcriptional regulator
MDSFDRRIIEALRDQKPKTFQEILSKVDFTHNTLRQHLDQLLAQGLVERYKRPQGGPGGPPTSTASLRTSREGLSRLLWIRGWAGSCFF